MGLELLVGDDSASGHGRVLWRGRVDQGEEEACRDVGCFSGYKQSPPITMRSIFMRLSDHFIGARGKKYVAKIYMAEKIRNSGNVGPFILRSVGVGSLRDSWWYTQRPRQQGRIQFST